MATEVGAKVQVEFSSVGQMRKAIKEATSDLVLMQEQFGKTSPQAIAAAKRIAELKDRIQDAKEQADLFDPGKRFSAFANAANQIAAGFSAVQGAMALVGTESEDLQKTLVKVQGAIALSQGLSQLKDLGKAYDEIKIVAVNAFRAIKTAIGSTGIGLLVIALGAIVAYWDDIKEAVTGVSEEQKKLNKESDKNLKTQQDKLSAINDQENILKLQGKSERDILNIKIKQTDETIKASEVQLQNSIATTKAQVEASKRNKEILQGIIEFVTAPIGLLLKGVDAVGKALGKNFDLYDKFYGSISSFVFDPKQVEEEGNKTIKEQEKALTELKNNRAGLQLQLRELDKKEADERIANAKKVNDEKIAFEKEFTKFIQDENARRLKLTQDSFDQERTAIDKKYADLIAKAKKFGLDTAEIEGLRFQETKDLVNKDTAERQTNLSKQLGDFSAMVPKMATVQSTITTNQATEATIRKQITDDEIQLELDKLNTKKQVTDSIISLVGAESNVGRAAMVVKQVLAAQEMIMEAKRTIFFGKTALAKSTVAVAEGTAQTAKIGFPQNIPMLIGYAVQAAGIIMAIKQAVTGVSSATSGAGGGSIPTISTPAPVTAQPSPTVTATAVNTQAVSNLGNQAMRAYVLNSDITNNDQRNAYLQRNARLG